MRTVSVAVPVLNGAGYLEELLAAVASQRSECEVELLVVDSGSTDGSVEISRSHGAQVIEIEPAEFGHGRTRNLACERASGEAIAFLTQDATPASDEWLAELIGGFTLGPDVGLVFGPHLPRAGTSPMIARELRDYFATFSPDGASVIQRAGDTPFFSNVNSCILRECWEAVRFRDIPYAEDQAFARDAVGAGWAKAYVPAAGVLHAHDYPWLRFMRRYFDEYRGLRATLGHVEPFGLRRTARNTAHLVRADLRYMRDEGISAPRRALWVPRAAAHHAGRALFSGLGSRASRLPARVQRAISLEGTAGYPKGRFGGEISPPAIGPAEVFGAVADRWRQPAGTLDPVFDGDLNRPWHIAWLVPAWTIGSGGHMALFKLASLLERRGHSSSVWVLDPNRLMHRVTPAVARRQIVEHFSPLEAGVEFGLDDWHGADVAFATGWQTAHPLWALDRVKLKTYLVQDHEPDFYAQSAERIWAEESYRLGYPAVCSSPWLSGLLRERHGVRAEHFEYAADLSVYRQLPAERDPDTVVFYARQVTPRRGTELGVLALAELLRRRPRTRVVIFGDSRRVDTPFEHEYLGVATPEALVDVYNRASVGLVISLTNYSLIPKEMMACGLPVVDVVGSSAASVFGEAGEVITLAEQNPIALADAMEDLLDEREKRERIAAAARSYVESLSWEAAAEQIEGHLRSFMTERLDTVSRDRSS